MKTLDELRAQWNNENKPSANEYDRESFERLVHKRVRKESGTAIQYFWASFALQILVYALLSHVIIKYWRDPYVLIPSIVNLALYVPFTYVLMKRFKKMATIPHKVNPNNSIMEYVARHRDVLAGFYRFKQTYEYLLIPVSVIIGTVVTFQIWVPGGVFGYPSAAAMIGVVSLVSCIVAIRNENRKHFNKPIEQLNAILREMEGG